MEAYATMEAHKSRAQLQRLGSLHIFERKAFSTLTYCNLCRDFMWGLTNEGVCCVVCGYAAHGRCIESFQPEDSCRLTSLPDLCGLTTVAKETAALKRLGFASEQEVFEVHHWVEGNTYVASACFLCHETLTSQGTGSYRCSRCRLQAHEECLINCPETVCNPLHERLLVRKRQNYAEDATPLLVFVNSRSGGQQGAHLIRKFRKLLNPNQVVDLDQGGPIPALRRLLPHPRLRILACGGDGTVGWVLSALDEFPDYRPEVAVLPLGTGNDLARVLGWGGGYAEEKLSPILDQIEHAQTILLDRWRLTVFDADGKEAPALAPAASPTPSPVASPPADAKAPLRSASATQLLSGQQGAISTPEQKRRSQILPPSSRNEEPAEAEAEADESLNIQQELIVNNYFSIGVDAHAALAFHRLRNEAPALCSTRLGNKVWYALNGIKQQLLEEIPCIDAHVQIEIDGKSCYQGSNVGALIFLNLPSYMGGADLWGTSTADEFQVPTISDKKLEVVTVSGPIHLGNIAMGLTTANRIGQGSDIRIRFVQGKTLPVQVDGEPWEQQPAEIHIAHWNQVRMLRCCKPYSEGDSLASLDFAGTLF